MARALPAWLKLLAGVCAAITGAVVLLQVTGTLGHRPAGVPAGLVESAVPGTDPGRGDSPRGGQGAAVDEIPCESGERLTFHVHAHLYLLQDGVSQPVSENIGIPGDNPLLPRCFYWLHTHDRSGLVHMEAPRSQVFTLGQFFDIWGQPLTSTDVGRLSVPAGQSVAVLVDGKEYIGDPREVELKRHTQVVIELGRRVPPPAYDFGKS